MTDAVSWHTAIAGEFDARYTSSPAFRERRALWSCLISRYAKRGGAVLDAGCGSGVMTMLAARDAAHVLAFDASAAMVEIAASSLRDLAHVDLRVARLGQAGLALPGRYDLVLCSSVLEYVDDLWASFDWLAGALAPGGTILFSLPNGDSLYRKAERAVFRLSGRPRYFAHVRNVPRSGPVLKRLAERGFAADSVRFYAAAPGLSGLLRPLGLRRFSDTLFVVACRRAG